MKLHIAANDIEITPEVQDMISKKLLNKIEKFFSHYPKDSVSVNIKLDKGQRWGFYASAEIDLPGQNIYAEEKHKELEYAVVALSKELVGMLRKKKEKEYNR